MSKAKKPAPAKKKKAGKPLTEEAIAQVSGGALEGRPKATIKVQR